MNKKSKLAIIAAFVASFALSSLIVSYYLKTDEPNQSEVNRQNTEIAFTDLKRINVTIIEPERKEDIFYWLFPSSTLQVSEEMFIRLVKNLNVADVYYRTDNNWNGQFAFYILGETLFDRTTVLFWVNGTEWSWYN